MDFGPKHEEPRNTETTTWPDVDDPERPSGGRPGQNANVEHEGELQKSDTDQPPGSSESSHLPGEETSDKQPL